MLYKKSIFSQFAAAISHKSGHPVTFLAAVMLILIWAVSGPVFHFSDTWQLVINTGTTIITFLMVFLIQHTQNRDNYAVQLKLDEIIRAVKGAHNSLLDIEELTEDELQKIKKKYVELAYEARKELKNGAGDTGSPKV